MCVYTADIQCHLPELMTALKKVYCQWKSLGLYLGLDYFALKTIERNNHYVEECMMEMLATWGQGGECSRVTLKTALLKIKCTVSE